MSPDGVERKFYAIVQLLGAPLLLGMYRVRKVRMGRARGYGFFFDDRRAMLGWDGGLALTRYLVERNPNIQHD